MELTTTEIDGEKKAAIRATGSDLYDRVQRLRTNVQARDNHWWTNSEVAEIRRICKGKSLKEINMDELAARFQRSRCGMDKAVRKYGGVLVRGYKKRRIFDVTSRVVKQKDSEQLNGASMTVLTKRLERLDEQVKQLNVQRKQVIRELKESVRCL